MLEAFIRNAAQTYEHKEFGNVRVVEADGAVEFCGKDVAIALGYTNANDALKRHCKGVVKRYPLRTPGGTQDARFISEPDLYRLIAHSKLPNAQKFESWIFATVLPSIRKHGGYLTPEKVEEALTDPDTIIRLATNLKEERAKRQELEAENRELAPKALFADAVAASDDTMLVGELAKLLASNGINIGQNRLFAWLRGNGYLMKDGSWRNMPTQRSMDMGLFVVKETAIAHADGHVTLSRTPKVTGKGQRYFVGRFLDSSEAAFDCSIRKILDNERRG